MSLRIYFHSLWTVWVIAPVSQRERVNRAPQQKGARGGRE